MSLQKWVWPTICRPRFLVAFVALSFVASQAATAQPASPCPLLYKDLAHADTVVAHGNAKFLENGKWKMNLGRDLSGASSGANNGGIWETTFNGKKYFVKGLGSYRPNAL